MSLEHSAAVLSLQPIILFLSHTTLNFPHFTDEKAEGLRPITPGNYEDSAAADAQHTKRVTLASLLLPLFP